jgi:hypothetical protein
LRDVRDLFLRQIPRGRLAHIPGTCLTILASSYRAGLSAFSQE